jgi:hypothetical protein
LPGAALKPSGVPTAVPLPPALAHFPETLSLEVGGVLHFRHTPHRMKDHYGALGLHSAATSADIKKAFRQQAAMHHPDRNSAPDAAARFRSAQEAYEVLGDDARREAYDNNRKRNLLDNPVETAAEIWSQYFDRLI